MKTRFPGEVARWCPSLDTGTGSTLADLRGSDNLTLYNTPTWEDNAEKGGSRALSFNGLTQYAEVAASDTQTLADDFSVSVWIKTSDTGTQYVLGKLTSGSGNSAYRFYLSGANLLAILYQNDSANNYILNVTSGVTLNDGEWHHICITWDESGTTLKSYLDGELNDTDSTPSGTREKDAGAAKFRVSESSSGINGLVDDILICDQTLTASEVLELYQGGRGYQRRLSPIGGEVGWWCPSNARIGDGNIPDLSGSGNTGTLTNDPTWVEDDTRGGTRALSFDGTDDKIVVADSDSFNFTNSIPFSLCVWFKTSNTTDLKTIFDKRSTSGGPSNGFLMGIHSDGTARGYVRDDDDPSISEEITSTTTTLDDGEWHSLVYTYDDDTDGGGSNAHKLYVDGELEATGTTEISRIANNDDLVIGDHTVGITSSWDFFDGELDDARIFNRALSAAEAETLYMQGRAGQTYSLLPGTIGAWSPSLDQRADGAGTTLYDLTGNGGDATITNATWAADTSDGGAYALDLDGTGDYFSVSRSDTPVTFDKSFTFACWVTEDSASARGLFRVDDNTTTKWLNVQKEATDEVTVIADDGTTKITITGTVKISGWTHVAVVNDNGTWSLYLDGVLDANGDTTNSGDVDGGFDIHVGRGMSTDAGGRTTNDWLGKIDDVVILDHVASASEIRELASRRAYQRKFPKRIGPVPKILQVTGKSVTSMGSSSTLAYAYDVKAGSTLFCSCRITSGSTAIGLSDDVNGTWEMTDSTNTGMAGGYLRNSKAGSITVTITTDHNSNDYVYYIYEVENAQDIAVDLDAHTEAGTTADVFDVITIDRPENSIAIADEKHNGGFTATGPSGWTKTSQTNGQSRVYSVIDEPVFEDSPYFGNGAGATSWSVAPIVLEGTNPSFNKLMGLGSHAPDQNLQARFVMDDDSGDDTSGRNNNATANGTWTTTTGPKAGWLATASDLQNSDYLTAPADLSVNGSPNGFTVMTWIDTSAWSNGNQLGIAAEFDSENDKWQIYKLAWSGVARFQRQVGGASIEIVSTTNILTGSAWYHIAVTVMPDGLQKLYVNGVLEAEANASGVGVDAEITIGYMPTGLKDLDNPQCDTIIFDDVLSEQEINAIYTGPEPLNTAAPVHSGTPEVGTAFTPTNSTWSAQAGDTVNQEYQWWISGDSYGSAMTPIAGATSGSYTPVAADEGKYLLRVDRGVGSVSGYDYAEDEDTGWSAVVAAATGADYTLTCDAGSFTETGVDPDLHYNRTLALDAGSYTETGVAASLLVGRLLSLDAGSYTLTGVDVGLSKPSFGLSITCESGSFTETGVAADLHHNRTLALDAGSYTQTGVAASILFDRILSLDTGSYTLTGIEAGLSKGSPGAYSLTAETGTFTESGVDSNTHHNRLLALDAGSYTETGVDPGVLYNRVASLDAGSYAETGVATGTLYNRTLALDAGSYALTGVASSLLMSRILSLDTGSYTYSGVDATTTWSGATFPDWVVIQSVSISSPEANGTINVPEASGTIINP